MDGTVCRRLGSLSGDRPAVSNDRFKPTGLAMLTAHGTV